MIKSLNNTIQIIRDKKIVAINHDIIIYKNDIERDFDYYFSAVTAKNIDGFLVADYSQVAYHNIVGFDLFPILCPSLADRYDTISQYCSFADLKPDMVALDLGAYSGLASIVFSMIVGKHGKVIAVEPDSINYDCCVKNIEKFKQTKNMNNIELIRGAMWSESKTLFFSGEGCLGSHVINNPNQVRNKLESVQGFTLYELTKKLERLDFIKCDIEGAERYIFSDDQFFNRFRPKMIIEPHFCIEECVSTLSKYNYKINTVQQRGISNIPLLECEPL